MPSLEHKPAKNSQALLFKSADGLGAIREIVAKSAIILRHEYLN